MKTEGRRGRREAREAQIKIQRVEIRSSTVNIIMQLSTEIPRLN
jgi:hypothetical protein